MAAPIHNNGGRKPKIDEDKMNRLLDKSVDYLLNNFDKFDDKIKTEIALKITVKRVPQNMDLTSGGEAIFHIINKTDGNNDTAQLQSGQPKEISS